MTGMKQREIDFGTEPVSRILLTLAPPVMLAQLIQALYNIVDSFFIGRYDENGLTALSIIYPMQLLMIALAVGTGVGINTGIAHFNGLKRHKRARDIAGVGTPLALFLWALFALIAWLILPWYASISTDSPVVAGQVVQYGRLVCVFSIGLFLESIWTKVHQAEGDMKLPMVAQIVGALVNIALDPVLIFGFGPVAALGIKGAAIATVAGQIVAAMIVWKGGYVPSPKRYQYANYCRYIFGLGIPNILMQSAYTFYILGLNLILAGFCDQAVTALGLYYKWQTIFFIPLGALQTCIVPILSYNYARKEIARCRSTLRVALAGGIILMALGTLCFLLFPEQMLRVFSSDAKVIAIGTWGFRFVGVSFLGMVTSLIFPVFFQATGYPVKSSLLTVLRTVVLFVPLGYLLSRFGLRFFWLTFPLTEAITTGVGFLFYRQFLKKEKQLTLKKD